MTAPGPTEEPLDSRALAAMLRNDRSVLRPIERTTAASIIDAFAELPDPTRRLAHAAATVRARLGEGWLCEVGRGGASTVDFWSADHSLGVRFLPALDETVLYVWRNTVPLVRSHHYPSLDDAITAALAALEPTP